MEASSQHQETLDSNKILVLKNTSDFPLVTTFKTPFGQTVARLEADLCCGCFTCVESEEQQWLDPQDRLFMTIKEEERSGIFSTRRAATVKFPGREVAGKVVIKTSSGDQNNSVRDAEERVLATFGRKNRILGTTTTIFTATDDDESRHLALMKHENGGRKVVIEFSDECDARLKVLIMAAGILYRKGDIEGRRRRTAAAAR